MRTEMAECCAWECIHMALPLAIINARGTGDEACSLREVNLDEKGKCDQYKKKVYGKKGERVE